MTIAVCSLGVGYLTLWGADSRLNETLAMGYFGLWGATLGSYVFGAVWHDTSLMGRARSRIRPEGLEASPEQDSPQ